MKTAPRTHRILACFVKGSNTMNRLSALAAISVALLILEAVLLVGDAVARQKSPREQLVGAWTFVSADSVRNDGSKAEVFGSNPKGTLIFTSDGHFALVQMRADLPKFTGNSRDRGTPEENKAVVQGSIAYFGSYSVNETEKAVTLQIEGSTLCHFINQVADQRSSSPAPQRHDARLSVAADPLRQAPAAPRAAELRRSAT